VNASACTQQRMAETWSVSGPEMLAGTLQMQHMSEEMAQSFSQAARKHFLEGQEFFKRRIQEVIAEVPV